VSHLKRPLRTAVSVCLISLFTTTYGLAQSGYEVPIPLAPTSMAECAEFEARLDARARELSAAYKGCTDSIYNQCFRSGLSIEQSNRCHDRNQGGSYYENTECGVISYVWPRCRPLAYQAQCAARRSQELPGKCRDAVSQYQQRQQELQRADAAAQHQYRQEQQRQQAEAEQKLRDRQAQVDAISRGLANMTERPADETASPSGSKSEKTTDTDRGTGLLSTGDHSYDKTFQPMNDVKGIGRELASDRATELLKKGLSSLTLWGRTVVASYDTGEHAAGVINLGLSVPSLWSRFASNDSQQQLSGAAEVATDIGGLGSNPLSNIIINRGVNTIVSTLGTQLNEFEYLGSTFFCRPALSAQDSEYDRTTHVLQIPYVEDTPNLTDTDETDTTEEVISSADSLTQFTAKAAIKATHPSKR
jgi:hypothetical protein